MLTKFNSFEQVGLHNPCLGSKIQEPFWQQKLLHQNVSQALWLSNQFCGWLVAWAYSHRTDLVVSIVPLQRRQTCLAKADFVFIDIPTSLEGPSGSLSNKWPKMWRATNVVEK